MTAPMLDAIRAQRQAYQTWLTVARDQLNARDWTAAFRNATQPYPYYSLHFGDMTLTPLAKPLREATIVLIASGGVYRDDQPRFDDRSVTGDASYRLVPVDTARERLRIAHDHYDHAPAEQDINVVFPVDRLRELVAAGVIGALAPNALSFSGYITDAQVVTEQLATELLREARAQGADGALLVPV